jgi:segregation and condensation protein B
MNDSYLKNVIEAALFAAGRPLTLVQIAQLFDEHVRPSTAEVRAQLSALALDYETRGIEMKETASGFRVQVRGALASEISRLWPERPPRFSRALLETLALIAYRQPITRAEIEAVRGVAVNPNIIKTLLERSWVRVVGQRDVPGHPELLGTTREFLDYFGLKTLDELPPLAALTAMADVNLQLDLGEDAPAMHVPAAQESAAPMLDEDGAEDDEHSASAAAASELVACAPQFDS